MIGRKDEARQLLRLYKKCSAELVAIYGRWRVGKTYLVDEVLGDKITFKHAGLSPLEHPAEGLLNAQLESFYYDLLLHGMTKSHCPKSWLEAFYMLEKWLQEKDDGSRQVVFLDELPWMDTQRSGFITAFESFWNSWGCHRKNLMVVVCGSASSWILDNLINNHGGLYGRVTYEIKLSPFTLQECEEYLLSEQIRLSRYDIIQSYMIFGGIPYYLRYFEPGLSLAQNVDKVFFSRNAVLKDEYDRLFASVFSNPALMKTIVELLYSRNTGYTRKEIRKELGISSGGTLTKCLKGLIGSDFIVKYVPFGAKGKEEHYKLVDPFCLYYLHFVKNRRKTDEHFWQNNLNAPSVSIWRGYAFENVCFNHIGQIKRALGISGVRTECSAWSKRGKEAEGTQIDLIIDRDDNVINQCEMKYYKNAFTLDKAYYLKIMSRTELLSELISPRQVVRNTLIAPYGLKENEYSSVFTNVITADNLFEN